MFIKITKRDKNFKQSVLIYIQISTVRISISRVWCIFFPVYICNIRLIDFQFLLQNSKLVSCKIHVFFQNAILALYKAISRLYIHKNSPDAPSTWNRLVRRVEVEETTRHKWVKKWFKYIRFIERQKAMSSSQHIKVTSPMSRQQNRISKHYGV